MAIPVLMQGCHGGMGDRRNARSDVISPADGPPPAEPAHRVDETSAVPRTDILRGILFMLLQAFLFTSMDALVKLATERHPTGQIVFFRNLFAMLPLSFFIRQAGGVAILRTRRILGQHVLRSLGGVTSMVALFLAYSYMPLADAMAISTSGPIFLTALSVPLLGEKVGWRRWAAVIVGFIGILIITRPGTGVFGAPCCRWPARSSTPSPWCRSAR